LEAAPEPLNCSMAQNDMSIRSRVAKPVYARPKLPSDVRSTVVLLRSSFHSSCDQTTRPSAPRLQYRRSETRTTYRLQPPATMSVMLKI
jgi:hypothetical protein